MNNQSNQDNDLNHLLNKYHIDRNKYISFPKLTKYNPDDVIEKKNIYDLICPICANILKDSISCSLNNNSHSFCKECIDIYLNEKDKCPICKQKFEYQKNLEIEKLLNKLSFKCFFKKEGCEKILNYQEYLNHINECKYNNLLYECQIEKFNYLNKNFEKCNYRGDLYEIEKHIKLCGFLKYKCKYCNEKIIYINLKEHVENKCKIGIINCENGDKYIGEKRNKTIEGYGILYLENGDKYEGEFKNNKFEGYGIRYFSNGDKYEGQFNNGIIEGNGIYYFINGNKYEGEFKNGEFEGNGIFYFSSGDKYEGEFKKSEFEGYGIYYFIKGFKYIGGFKNGQFEGYGIKYYPNGYKYKGRFINNRFDGYGILYFTSGDKYEGEFKRGKYEGYGIDYLPNGAKYEGEFKNGRYDGYGIKYFSNGDKYEGQFKKGKFKGYGIIYISDGDKYEGQFKNDKFEGYGEYYFNMINLKYIGHWKNSFPKGDGILCFSKNYKCKIKWNSGLYYLIIILYNIISIFHKLKIVIFILILIFIYFYYFK